MDRKRQKACKAQHSTPRPKRLPLCPNIPAGGNALAGCAPFARRGETRILRAALNLKTAPTRAAAG